MSAIEIAVQYSKRLESILEQRYCASGRGLHEKITSVETRLPSDVVRSLRWVATLRNKVVHEPDYKIEDINRYQSTCETLIARLQAESLNKNLKSSSPSKVIFTPPKGSNSGSSVDMRWVWGIIALIVFSYAFQNMSKKNEPHLTESRQSQ